MRHDISATFPQRLWVSLINSLLWVIVLIVLSLVPPALAPATAVVMQHEVSPGQILYQSRHSLRDAQGLSWQVIVFTSTAQEQGRHLALRLVGFPGTVNLQHPQPLILRLSLGLTLIAEDVTSQIGVSDEMMGNLGQYDLDPLLPQLSLPVPLQISARTTTEEMLTLNISPEILQEWRSLAADV